MAKLDAAERKEIPTKEFALPKERKFPVEDKAHAANAKSRAKAMLRSGSITEKQYNEICAKADKVLGEKMAKSKDKPKAKPAKAEDDEYVEAEGD